MVLSSGLNLTQNKEEVFSVKKSKIIGILAIPALLLTGCVDSMPDLTKEQSEMISEYAAGLLLKYSPNYNYRIVDVELIEQAMALEQASEETSQEIFTEDILEEKTDKENSLEIESEEGVEASAEYDEELQNDDIDSNIAEMFAMEDIIIKYNSYELCDSYPENNTGFIVDAAQNKKLLVVYFDAETVGEQAVECNLIGEKFNISLSLNGNKVNILNTMIPNELATFLDTIEGGKIQQLVTVAEIDEISDDDVLDLKLKISNNNYEYNFKLK